VITWKSFRSSDIYGFAIHRTEEGGFDYKLSSRAGIFTAEVTALFVTLRDIEEVIQKLT
jgi:hypothetical protein